MSVEDRIDQRLSDEDIFGGYQWRMYIIGERQRRGPESHTPDTGEVEKDLILSLELSGQGLHAVLVWDKGDFHITWLGLGTTQSDVKKILDFLESDADFMNTFKHGKDILAGGSSPADSNWFMVEDLYFGYYYRGWPYSDVKYSTAKATKLGQEFFEMPGGG